MTATEHKARIADAFEYVARVYEETALLMKDLHAALGKHGFKPLAGNSNGHSGSRSLDYPREWCPRFVSGYWVPDASPKSGPTARYLGATVVFFDRTNRAIDPVFLYGLVRSMAHEQASSQHWWLWDIYYNADEAFKWDGERFTCTGYGSSDYTWPASGVLRSRPLTSIVGPSDVEELAVEMLALWESKRD